MSRIEQLIWSLNNSRVDYRGEMKSEDRAFEFREFELSYYVYLYWKREC